MLQMVQNFWQYIIIFILKPIFYQNCNLLILMVNAGNNSKRKNNNSKKTAKYSLQKVQTYPFKVKISKINQSLSQVQLIQRARSRMPDTLPSLLPLSLVNANLISMRQLQYHKDMQIQETYLSQKFQFTQTNCFGKQLNLQIPAQEYSISIQDMKLATIYDREDDPELNRMIQIDDARVFSFDIPFQLNNSDSETSNHIENIDDQEAQALLNSYAQFNCYNVQAFETLDSNQDLIKI